ncbi:uncharacterized protein LOC110098352 [Dendrobium catenatum]|uniref:uncharacterized protein LOC110098352 n=1 Tax=Dendrobium catenatum TaxID=906689 RepID=UPI0009F446E3|nr:uncharacterized protein LOC110098352 [Dendrobium catenatum]
MSLLRSQALSKISAVSAAGEFLCSGFSFSRCLFIPKLTFNRRFSSPTARLFHAMAQKESEQFSFGPYKINPSEVFYSTKLSYALVNLRPLLPGHVLVCPRREVKRFVDLTADETTDLWLVAKEVGGKLERHHKASSLTFAIQVVNHSVHYTLMLKFRLLVTLT